MMKRYSVDRKMDLIYGVGSVIELSPRDRGLERKMKVVKERRAKSLKTSQDLVNLKGDWCEVGKSIKNNIKVYGAKLGC